MKYCSNCGKELKLGAKFCSGCGTAVIYQPKPEIQPTVTNPEVTVTTKDGEIHKCPSCGEKLSYDALVCPRCGYEVRGRKANKSLEEFSSKLVLETDESKDIELIKTYPIPNNREDIFEFLVLASSNFDAKFYASNKTADSVAAAWLVKIDQCYTKAKLMVNDQKDLVSIESLYNEVHSKIKKYQKKRKTLVIVGIVLILVSVIFLPFASGEVVFGFIVLSLLASGIVCLVAGLKKAKTNTQLNKEQADKEHKRAIKEDRKVEKKNNVAEAPKRYTIFNSSGQIVNKAMYLFLAIAFGWMGLHRVYSSPRKARFLIVIVYTLTVGLFVAGWIIDVVQGFKKIPDSNGNIAL